MPRYCYECENASCPTGGEFDVVQSIHDDALADCPHCGGPVNRVVRPVGMAAPTGDAKLKEMGFTKLVRRDRGVYENVTRMDHEARYFHGNKPETRPDIRGRVQD